MADKNFKVKTGLDTPVPLPVSMGGTGQTSTNNTLNSLLPAQAGNSNKVLSTDGTNTTWVAQATAYQRGTTAQRPQAPAIGDLYYNTELNYFESYTSNGWFPIAAAPLAPTGVTATNQGTGRAFNNGQMSVSFTPNSNGGAPSSFVVTPSPSTSPATFTGSASPITVTGLTSGTQYTYTITSTSPYGTSSASSASSAVTATTLPQVPSVSAVGGNAQATLTITGANGGSTITEYTITSSPATTTQTTSNTTYVFTGLTNGTTYTFTATATNANGTSAASAASNSVTPAIPNVPSDVLVLAGGGGGGVDSYSGGGGGAGGILTGSYNLTGGVTYSIQVGSGGGTNSNGTNSVLSGSNFITLTAIGGGHGAGGSGGCGGAAVMWGSPGSGTAGPPRQGYDGGSSGCGWGAGGGTAAVGDSVSATTGVPSNGGIGTTSATLTAMGNAVGLGELSGGNRYFGGGGGGGFQNSAICGRNYPSGSNGLGNGAEGTGGGGAGAGGSFRNGRSGCVIIRYPDSYSAASSVTGSPTVAVTGGYRYYAWTGSGSITL